MDSIGAFVLQNFVRNDVKLRERVDATNVKKRSKKGVFYETGIFKRSWDFR